MSAPATHGYGYQDPSRRIKGVVVVVVVHVLIGYALVSGMARESLKLIKKPLEAVVIQEVIIPPPPPPPAPPPKQVKAPQRIPKPEAPPPPFVPPAEVTPAITSTPPPVIVSTPTPSPAPVVVAAPPPPVAPPTINPNRSDMGVACPIQVPPGMPRRALRDGIGGVVKARARISDGVVREVTILSGPQVFHAAVREAMLQYKCTKDASEVIAVQEFNFKIE